MTDGVVIKKGSEAELFEGLLTRARSCGGGNTYFANCAILILAESSESHRFGQLTPKLAPATFVRCECIDKMDSSSCGT